MVSSDDPTNVGIARGTLTLGGDTIVVVSDGVDIWVAPRFSCHLYLLYNLDSVGTPGQVLHRIVKKKKTLRATHH